MADPCSGGVSGPKAGVAETIVFASSALASLLNNRGAYWAYLVAPLLGVLSYQATELCEIGPPDDPEMTAADFDAMLKLTDSAAVETAIGKLTDLVRIAAWYQLCECKTTGTPAPPTAPFVLPVDVSNQSRPTNWIPMLRSQCKVLDLWNGSSNNSPPSNWQLATFDDSAWSSPPLFNDAPGGPNNFYQNGGSGAQVLPDGAVKWQAVGVATATNQSQFLVRWRVTLPYLPTNDIAVAIPGFYSPGAPSGLTSGTPYVNGAPGVMFNATNWQGLEDDYLPGQANLIAFHANSSAGSAVMWAGNIASMMFGLLYPGANLATGIDCCDQLESAIGILRAEMLNLKELLTLVQRQGVPFAYVPGLEYAALTGSGEITFSDPIIRLKVTLTDIPEGAGMAEGSPDRLFDMGFVSLGTADGYEPPQRITTSPFMLQVPGDITKIGYTLSAGVTATINTFSREP